MTPLEGGEDEVKGRRTWRITLWRLRWKLEGMGAGGEAIYCMEYIRDEMGKGLKTLRCRRMV